MKVTALNSSILLRLPVDSPVRLRYAVTNVDQFYQAATAWPANERTADIENTLLKVVAVSQEPPELQRTNLPFSATESKFLIGLAFRLTLRDVIFSSQLRHNQGVLKQPLKKSKRWAAYNEIMQYSLWDYIQDFARPYDKTKGIDLTDPETVEKGSSLRAASPTPLARQPQNIRPRRTGNWILLCGQGRRGVDGIHLRSGPRDTFRARRPLGQPRPTRRATSHPERVLAGSG